MSSSKPQIVLFPGAWHKPSCFSHIIPKLEAAGYAVRTAQLPSVTDHNPPKDLNADIATVRSTVDEAIGSGNDVVVIPHSWAGIVVGSALTGYSKKEREAKGEKGGVVRCGCMSNPGTQCMSSCYKKIVFLSSKSTALSISLRPSYIC